MKSSEFKKLLKEMTPEQRATVRVGGRPLDEVDLSEKALTLPKAPPSEYGPPGVREVSIPIRVIGESNARKHWRQRHERAAKQRVDTALVLASEGWPRQKPRAVHFVRHAPRKLDAGDNLAGAFKAIRDELFTHLGCNDGDPEIQFTYDQVQTTDQSYSITLKVTF